MEELIKNNSRVNYFDPRRSINYTPPLSADEFDKIKSCPNYEKYGLFPTDTREGIIAKHKDCCFPDDNTTILVISAIIALGFGTILGLYFMNFNK
jgi:hypothetical protein